MITAQRLVRWSGMVAIVAGALFAVSRVFQPSGSDVNAVLQGSWTAVNVGLAVSGLLLLFGLIGMYACQVEEMEVLGLIGFVLAFIGTVLFTAFAMYSAYYLPVLAVEAPSIIENAAPLFSGSGVSGVTIIGIVRIWGFILFGISMMRVAKLPQVAAFLIVVGILPDAFAPLLPPVAVLIGRVIFAAGLVWLGYALWTGAGEKNAPPQDKKKK